MGRGFLPPLEDRIITQWTDSYRAPQYVRVSSSDSALSGVGTSALLLLLPFAVPDPSALAFLGGVTRAPPSAMGGFRSKKPLSITKNDKDIHFL